MNIVKAVALKIASTLMFALMGAQVRYLGGTFPVGEVAFCRAVFALIPILIVFGWRGELRGALRTSRPMDHVLRGAFSVVGTFCTFGALARLPLADYTAIAFIAPLITVIFAGWCAVLPSRSSATASRHKHERGYGIKAGRRGSASSDGHPPGLVSLCVSTLLFGLGFLDSASWT